MTPRASTTLEDVLAGRWRAPGTGAAPEIPIASLVLRDSLAGAEAELLAPLDLGGHLAVVADPDTYDALGQRVVQAIDAHPGLRSEAVILDSPHADEATVAEVRRRTVHADALVAVGAGTLNDLAKYAAYLDGRPFAVFATAASMNGYTSSTAAITDANGMKRSLPAQSPRGLFMDLSVLAAAPAFLSRAGLGDCLCRSTAQVDWLMSHLLRDTFYDDSPFALQETDEAVLLAQAEGVGRGDRDAIDALVRVLTLCGLGVLYSGTSHHGSMGEHMISHYIDMFAGEAHPGTLHGHQVGVAAVSMARLQRTLLTRDRPPHLHPTGIDPQALRRRYGDAIAEDCLAQWRRKALDPAEAERLNTLLEARWESLRKRLLAKSLPAETLSDALAVAGAANTADGLGLDRGFYRQTLGHAREIRDRFTFLDIAGDSGELAGFAAAEAGAA